MEIDEKIKEVQETDSELEAGKKAIEETLEQEKTEKKLKRKKVIQSRLLIVGIIVSIVGIFLAYIISPFSNVRSVKVINNVFLSEDYIKKSAGISTDSEFVLLFPMVKEISMKTDPLIKDVDIRRGANHSVVIDVKENDIVGYRYDQSMDLILGDGSYVTFKSEYISNLSLLPMFMSVSDEKTKMVAEEMKDLDPDVLYRIAEVRDFALSYDENMIKFVMEDGYKVYTTITGSNFLKDYLSIIKNTGSSHKCIYFDTENNVAVMRSCEQLEELYQRHLHGDETPKPEDTAEQEGTQEETGEQTSEETHE
ncbi:MAG: FtsQ-type POTRA domain-containing protein [Erysipelotrichaceae bacterium]|nr:FtsQ-type POTRA domain-containing protein [Erysipelotrichaceae bacterium]MBR0473579.1 FtsQ-type POTRA domain-containing protein [Erysipelotrichaceae bacterium]